MGCGHVILNSDKEQVMQKLPNGTLIVLRITVRDEDPEVQVVIQDEHLSPYAHASNGLAESPVRTYRQ